MNWPDQTRQDLSDILGFDVENPKVLTEMSGILAIENMVAKDPDGVSFEPVIIDLDKEFDDVPEKAHNENPPSQGDSLNSNSTIIYSLIFIVILIGLGSYFVLKKKPD